MNKQRKYLLVTIAVLSVILTALCGVAYAKYVETTELPGSITISAKLAHSIEVLESKANRNDDGSYTLQAGSAVTSNSYILIPGLDVPKDPYVKITGKTSIEAYVFIEVKDTFDNGSGVTYELMDHWKKLNIDGKNVYVYCIGDEPVKVTDETEGLDKIQILKDDIIEVSQHLNLTGAETLEFYASIGQVAAGNTAEEVYQSITTP